MSSFSHIPMVRITIPFMAGVILFANLQRQLVWEHIVILSITLLISGFLIKRYLLANFEYRFAFGINAKLFLIFAGYVLAQERHQLSRPDHFIHHPPEGTLLRLRLTEPISEKANSFQIRARVTHVVDSLMAISTRGKLIVWLQKDSLAAGLRYGDVIYIENQLQEVSEPMNPHAFNFKRFLAFQNIFHQAYRRSGQWHHSGHNQGNPLIASAHQLREKALKTLEANNIKGREFAVASALLLGYREYLDEDLQREFAGAGAMHILCVSGLHVGIIFLALNLIFGFLGRLPRGKLFKTAAIIAMIWFYAAITGFSPSVLRASTMFSFVAIGQSFNRKTNIYNTLAASALLLMILDPFIIQRIGFQLSYVAVLSIVWLQPMFYKWAHFKNPVLDHAWGIITVSLAAQLGTGPLALYYFNQFPNYFLLTNLVVIPLTGLIIKSGIIMFIVSPISILGQIAGHVLAWIILVLHNAVRIIEGLPYSVSNHVYISFADTLLIFGLILLGGLFWSMSRKSLSIAFLLLLLMFSSSLALRSIKNQEQLSLVVYHVPNTTAIDIIEGRNCFFVSGQIPEERAGNLDFHLGENRLRAGIKPRRVWVGDTVVKGGHFYLRKPFLQLGMHTLLWVNQQNPAPDISLVPVSLDFLILSDNASFDLPYHSEYLQSTKIIIDSSSGFRQTSQWIQQCDTLGLDCWSVRHQGAFVLNLQKKSLNP